jgi:hypothetical protein
VFAGQDDFINGLQQTGAEFAMNLNGGSEDEGADFVFVHDEILTQRRGGAERILKFFICLFSQRLCVSAGVGLG